VKGTVAGVTTTYIGNYFEWTGSTSTMKKYYYAGSIRVAMRTGSGTGTTGVNWLFGDHLGSQSVTAEASGSKIAEVRYKAWGEDRYVWGTTPTSYRYTGQRSETSLSIYYYGARWYDSSLGRFLSPDTVVPGSGDTQGWDRFAYSYNNLLIYTDPSGHDPVNHSCYEQGDPGCGRPATASDRAASGDIGALADLLVPTHIGVRIQLEGSLDLAIIAPNFGISVNVAGNIVYNRASDQLSSSVDWTVAPGGGIGAGASLTEGLLLGWGSSNVNDVTSGQAAVAGGTVASGLALSTSVTSPLETNSNASISGLHVDPVYGQVPATVYFGIGAGAAYGSAGLGRTQTLVKEDASSLLPWR
jgi:RHS repeat-associated protein